MPKRRTRPSSRKLRAYKMTRGAVHPADLPPPPLPASPRCQVGRHQECGGCGCECHEPGPP
jgi:hypothetical protein